MGAHVWERGERVRSVRYCRLLATFARHVDAATTAPDTSGRTRAALIIDCVEAWERMNGIEA